MIDSCIRFLSPPLPIEIKDPAIKNLTEQLKQVQDLQYKLPNRYRSCPAGRVLAIALTIIIVALTVMAAQGTLSAFPQNFVNFFSETNLSYIGGALAVGGVLTIGASFVFRRVLNQVDRITEHDIGELKGDDHWVSAVYIYTDQEDPQKSYSMPGYIDTSTLKNKSGKAFMYAYKDPVNHYQVSLNILATTALYWVGTIVYNTLRLFIIPFYIAYRMAMDKPSTDSEKKYRWSDITDEWQKTACRILNSIWYAWALMLSALYSFIDPLNGRKLGSYVERVWNEGVTRAEGYWSIGGPQALWKFEGGRRRDRRGKNGFYLAGCWQPVAVVTYKNGQIVQEESTSLSKAINPNRGKSYTILTKEMLNENYTTIKSALTKAQQAATSA